jgi:hypothetical protein
VKRFSVRARERNVFSRGSSPGTRLANALQTLGKRLADPSRSVGDGVALISECRFMRYSLAFQGITFESLVDACSVLGKWLWDGLEQQTDPTRGNRSDGFGNARETLGTTLALLS